MESLSELLRDKSLEFYTRYAYIRELAGSGFQRYATMIGYLTDHGEQHYCNLETNLSLLLPDETKQQLAVEELFVLLCAVHFHDVGLLSEHYTDEPWISVRKDHVNRTYDYLHKFYEDWGLNRFEAYAIKNICLGHSGDTLYDLPEESVIHRTKVRIQFLAALLRVADELDLDYTRVSPFIPRLKQIPEESLKHWKKHEEIGGVLIDPKSWTIEVHAMPMSEESRTIIESLVEQKLQKELEYVRPILEKHGLYYRQVTVRYESFGEKRSTVRREAQRRDKGDSLDSPMATATSTRAGRYVTMDGEKPVARPIVFVSYSHRDEREKDRLLSHLRVLRHAGLIDLWSDDRIGVGADWEAEIKQAIAQARVAILLVSANFLTSEFILSKEVPALLQRREAEGLIIFPVIAKACVWQSVDWLAKMNVRPKNGRPVWSDAGSHVDEDLAAIAEEVAAIVRTVN